MRAWVIGIIVAAVIFLLVLVGLGVWLVMGEDEGTIVGPTTYLDLPVERPRVPIDSGTLTEVDFGNGGGAQPPLADETDYGMGPGNGGGALPLELRDEPLPLPPAVRVEEKMLSMIGTAVGYNDFSSSCFPNAVTEVTMRGRAVPNSLQYRCSGSKTLKTAAGVYPIRLSSNPAENVAQVFSDPLGFDAMWGKTDNNMMRTVRFDGPTGAGNAGWNTTTPGMATAVVDVPCPSGKKVVGFHGQQKSVSNAPSMIGSVGIICG